MTENAEQGQVEVPHFDIKAGIRYLFRDAARNFLSGLNVARQRRKGLLSHDQFVAAIDRIFPTNSPGPN
jgi:hypothetical protein